MPRPDGGLVTETNRQYYAGAQQQYSATGGVGINITSTFDTNLIFGSSDPTNGQYGLNNFLLYKSADALTWTEITPVTTVQNAIANENGGVAAVNITLTAVNANIIAGMSIYGGGITNNPTGAKVVSVNGAVVTLDTAIAFQVMLQQLFYFNLINHTLWLIILLL